MELREFEMKLVRRVPETLEYGVLYVCFECNVVVHLCACGCGEKVVLPIDPQFWSVRYDGEHLSLSPSIGNFQFNCKSHYWIKDNQVIWVPEKAVTKETHNKKCLKHENSVVGFMTKIILKIFKR